MGGYKLNPYSNGVISYSLTQMYQPPYSQYTAPVRFFLVQPPSIYDYRCKSKAETDYVSMNRLLWMEHVNWTRMVITSIVFNLPDVQFVEERLLRNATDLGNCLRPFYGDQIADHYTKLIHDHLTIAAELVTAAVKGDTATANAKEIEWYKNADDIAVFWSKINPYLKQEDVKKMFYTHLDLTKKEAVTMIQKKYKEDIATFDQIVMEVLMMSDMLTNAVVMQFYQYFQCRY